MTCYLFEGIKYEKENSGTKTPVKPRNPFFRENMSSSKSSNSIGTKKQTSATQSARAPLIKSHSLNFQQKTNLSKKIDEVENDIDETMSMYGGHDTTDKSMVSTASFMEEPKMNSTIILQSRQETTAYDRRATVTISKNTASASAKKPTSAQPRRKLL